MTSFLTSCKRRCDVSSAWPRGQGRGTWKSPLDPHATSRLTLGPGGESHVPDLRVARTPCVHREGQRGQQLGRQPSPGTWRRNYPHPDRSPSSRPMTRIPTDYPHPDPSGGISQPKDGRQVPPLRPAFIGTPVGMRGQRHGDGEVRPPQPFQSQISCAKANTCGIPPEWMKTTGTSGSTLPSRISAISPAIDLPV